MRFFRSTFDINGIVALLWLIFYVEHCSQFMSDFQSQLDRPIVEPCIFSVYVCAYVYVFVCEMRMLGLLETPIDSGDIPVIRNTKSMYQSCINLSMISSVCISNIRKKLMYNATNYP